MAQEIEVKFPLLDRAELIRKLHEIGATRLYPETFEDNIVLDRRGELRTRGSLPWRSCKACTQNSMSMSPPLPSFRS